MGFPTMRPSSKLRTRTQKARSRRSSGGTPRRSTAVSTRAKPSRQRPPGWAGVPSRPTDLLEQPERRTRLDRGEVDRLDELRAVVSDAVHEVGDRFDRERDLVARLEQRPETVEVGIGVQPLAPGLVRQNDWHSVVKAAHLLVRPG